MNVESVRLNVNLKSKGTVHTKGTIFSAPFPQFIREEISTGSQTLEILKRSGDPDPVDASAKTKTEEQERIAKLEEDQKLAEIEMESMKGSFEEREAKLLEKIKDLTSELEEVESFHQKELAAALAAKDEALKTTTKTTKKTSKKKAAS